MGKVGCGANEQYSIAVDQFGDVRNRGPIARVRARNKVDLDLEVLRCFAKGRMSSRGKYHLRLAHTSLIIRLLPRSQYPHDDTLSPTRSRHTRPRVRRRIKQRKHHGHHLSLHLPHSWKDIRMYRITDSELLKSLRLQIRQLHTTMINRTGNPPSLPRRMLHIPHLLQLGSNLLRAPSRRRQSGEMRRPRPRGHKLRLQVRQSFCDICAHFGLDEGEFKEERVALAVEGVVEPDY